MKGTTHRLQKGFFRLSLVATAWLFILLPIHSTAAEAAGRGLVRIQTKVADGSTKEIDLYSGYYALVVGCGDYKSGWPPLPNPVKDAREVAEILRGLGWSVDVLEDPDWAGLRKGLNKIITETGRDRHKGILFWFSGHGHTLEEVDGTKLGYIVPVDAPDPDQDELGFMERAINIRQMETITKRIMAKHVLMVFDSCFSGAIFNMVRAKPSPYIQEEGGLPGEGIYHSRIGE